MRYAFSINHKTIIHENKTKATKKTIDFKISSVLYYRQSRLTFNPEAQNVNKTNQPGWLKISEQAPEGDSSGAIKYKGGEI